MHTGSLSFPAGRPDIASVVLHDFPDDGKSDSAPSLRRIPGGVRPVKSVKNIGEIPRRDSFSVVLDLNPDAVMLVEYPDADAALLLIHIFYTITHNIVNHALHLLWIRNDPGLGRDQVRVVELNSSGIHIHTDLFHAVSEVVAYVESVEIVWDPVALKA